MSKRKIKYDLSDLGLLYANLLNASRFFITGKKLDVRKWMIALQQQQQQRHHQQHQQHQQQHHQQHQQQLFVKTLSIDRGEMSFNQSSSKDWIYPFFSFTFKRNTKAVKHNNIATLRFSITIVKDDFKFLYNYAQNLRTLLFIENRLFTNNVYKQKR